MAGKKGRKKGSSADVYFSRYDYRTNKITRLTRHLKRQENDGQAQAALRNAQTSGKLSKH